MHRPFDVAQRRASRTNARYRKVRGTAGKIEKNLTHLDGVEENTADGIELSAESAAYFARATSITTSYWNRTKRCSSASRIRS